MTGRINRRNYYRILHVQPDAPVEVIRASYRTLMHKLRYHPDLGGDDWNAALLNEAMGVLTDPGRRAAYDAERRGRLRPSRGGGETPGAVASGARGWSRGSRPAACPLCAAALPLRPPSSCPRCRSPLSPPPAAAATLRDQRRYARLAHNAPLHIHGSWPKGEPVPGRFRDLSPAGVQVASGTRFATGQIVLIESELLAAIGEVASCSRSGGTHIAGIAFLTLRFHAPRGTFVSDRV